MLVRSVTRLAQYSLVSHMDFYYRSENMINLLQEKNVQKGIWLQARWIILFTVTHTSAEIRNSFQETFLVSTKTSSGRKDILPDLVEFFFRNYVSHLLAEIRKSLSVNHLYSDNTALHCLYQEVQAKVGGKCGETDKDISFRVKWQRLQVVKKTVVHTLLRSEKRLQCPR